MATVKILAFNGSLRADSYNKKLVLQACDILKDQGCIINFLDLRSLGLPFYDGDCEVQQGIPEGGQKLIKAINETDGLCIGNPEYNSGITGALKNAIDWTSRAESKPFAEKPILLVGTSTGIFGASKSHLMTRQILTQLGAVVIPSQITIPSAGTAFDEKGNLKNPAQVKLLHGACAQLIKFAGFLKRIINY